MSSSLPQHQTRLIAHTIEDVDGACEIRMYGKDADGRTSQVTATGFRPFFITSIPDGWREHVHIGSEDDAEGADGDARDFLTD